MDQLEQAAVRPAVAEAEVVRGEPVLGEAAPLEHSSGDVVADLHLGLEPVQSESSEREGDREMHGVGGDAAAGLRLVDPVAERRGLEGAARDAGEGEAADEPRLPLCQEPDPERYPDPRLLRGEGVGERGALTCLGEPVLVPARRTDEQLLAVARLELDEGGDVGRGEEREVDLLTADAAVRLAHSPVLPSIASRSRSRWPACRAYSSIRCVRIQRRFSSRRPRSPRTGPSRSVQPACASRAAATLSR